MLGKCSVQCAERERPVSYYRLYASILFRCYGITAVYKFIQEEFILLVNQDINNANSPKKPSSPSLSTNQADNPVKLLHELIQAKSGTLEAEAHETEDKKWEVKIVAKLNEKALSFSHARTNASKQKAKTEASRDILTYFTNYPDVCQHLQVPVEGEVEIHVLPISENDYCHLFAETTTTTANRPALKTADWSGDSVNLSTSSHEEATMLLENLLLDSKMDVDSDPRQVKRARQSTQEADDDNNNNSTAQQAEGGLEQPASNVTYIRDEATFQPFNQPPEGPVDEATATRQEKILRYFRKLFAPHRLVLLQCRTTPGQSKTVFLSFAVQHQDELLVDISTQQGGDNHTPLFHAEVVLRSKTKINVFLKTEGHGRRKKDAEQQAFNKMIELVTNWNNLI